MARKASIFRLDPAAQSALAQLSQLLGRPMNKLVNEAVRDYLLKTSPRERELEGTLASLRAYRARDLRVAETSVAYHGTELGNDEAVEETIRIAGEFVRRLARLYSVKAAILFGSRARGTHRADSDLDIAIVLHGPRGRLMDISLAMADIAFDVLLETNIYIQPLPIREDEWEHPETHSNPRLIENIRRDGLAL
jgi:predicted nucleotidyltransferase